MNFLRVGKQLRLRNGIEITCRYYLQVASSLKGSHMDAALKPEAETKPSDNGRVEPTAAAAELAAARPRRLN